MKKVLFILGFSAMTLGFSSCACNCVGENNGNPNDKICKVDYENVYGAGTWANYETTAKSVGFVCK